MKADNVFAHAFDRINGHPGGYVRIAGRWRLEEVRKQRISNIICFERSTSVVSLCLESPKVSYLDPGLLSIQSLHLTIVLCNCLVDGMEVCIP